MISNNDAFGAELLDYLNGEDGTEIVERDDGYIDASSGPAVYFAEFEDWHLQEQEAFDYVIGRVLDIGVGAGRHVLYLQKKKQDVVGVDTSPGALQVCRQRGVRRVELLSITQLNAKQLGRFDTILMMGNNFGLFGNYNRAKRLLRHFLRLTNPKARILAQCMNPYEATNPIHRRYYAENRKRGRMSGQLRIRVRYKQYRTPWFDYLFVSQSEMQEIVEGTGWKIIHVTDSEYGMYTSILEKE